MPDSLKCFILGCWMEATNVVGSIIQCRRCKVLLTRVGGCEYEGWYQRWMEKRTGAPRSIKRL